MSEARSGYLQSGGTAQSMAELLNANLGREVVAQFIVGTDELVTKEGTLYAATAEYIILYDDQNLTNIVCDFASLRFVTFYLPGARPSVAAQNGRQSARAEGEGQSVTGGVSPVAGVRVQAQAAFNHAKRKARVLE